MRRQLAKRPGHSRPVAHSPLMCERPSYFTESANGAAVPGIRVGRQPGVVPRGRGLPEQVAQVAVQIARARQGLLGQGAPGQSVAITVRLWRHADTGSG